MADTLGGLIDKLITIDMKLWNNQEFLYEVRRMSFEDFEKKTRSAISSPLEAYSGLGWNTWQNQVGTSIAYKTPEYETAWVVDSAFKITAYNYPMFFPGPMKPSDDAVLDVARLAILNYNARNDSMKDGVLDLYEFNKLREDSVN